MVSEWYHVASGDDPRASLISSIRLCEVELGLEATKVILAHRDLNGASNGHPWRIEDLLERATRFEVEANPSDVGEYRDCIAQAWTNIAKGGL